MCPKYYNDLNSNGEGGIAIGPHIGCRSKVIPFKLSNFTFHRNQSVHALSKYLNTPILQISKSVKKHH